MLHESVFHAGLGWAVLLTFEHDDVIGKCGERAFGTISIVAESCFFPSMYTIFIIASKFIVGLANTVLSAVISCTLQLTTSIQTHIGNIFEFLFSNASA